MVLRSIAAAVILSFVPRVEARLCPTYAVVAEDSELFKDADVARWAKYALKMEGILDEKSPCYIYIGIDLERRDGARGLWFGALRVEERRSMPKTWTIVGKRKGLIMSFGSVETGNVANDIRQYIERFISTEITETEPLPDDPLLLPLSEIERLIELARRNAVAEFKAQQPVAAEQMEPAAQSTPPKKAKKK